LPAGVAGTGPRAYVATAPNSTNLRRPENLSAQEPSENELLSFVREQLAGASEQRIREALDGNRVEWVRRYRLDQQGAAAPGAERLDGTPGSPG
jgi:hypothetical protein